MTDSRECANDIVMAVTERERTDVRLPPAMVAIIITVYIIITIYYIYQMYQKYDVIPLAQSITLAALFTIGAGLLMAIFYLLLSRNKNHSKRESKLRASMIAYAESVNFVCGADITLGIERLKEADAKILEKEKPESELSKLFFIFLPILIGALIIIMSRDISRMIQIVAGSYGISLVIAVLLLPNITVFPKAHEKRTQPFYITWNTIAPSMGLPTERFDRTIGIRSFWLFLILTVLTLGLFMAIWVYTMFSDMNKHFDEQWCFEDCLLRGIRSKELGVLRNNENRGHNYVLEDNWVD